MTKLAKQFTGRCNVVDKRQAWARAVIAEGARLAKSESGSEGAGTNYVLEQIHLQKNKLKALAALHYEMTYRAGKQDTWEEVVVRRATIAIAKDMD
jgi:hypothetical protein